MNEAHESSESAPEGFAGSRIELLSQEIATDDPKSVYRFNWLEKQFVATPGALEEFGQPVIHNCIDQLRMRAEKHDGLDYLQVFRIGPRKQKLWIIEDAFVITALLPEEY